MHPYLQFYNLAVEENIGIRKIKERSLCTQHC